MAMNQGVDDEGQPRQIVPAYADFLTAAYIAWAITAAVLVKERTGEGQKVETSLLGSALSGAVGRLRFFDAVDAEPTEQFLTKLREMRQEQRPWKEQLALRAERLVPANIYYRSYATADSYVVVACLNNPTRVKLLEIIGIEDERMIDGQLQTAVDPTQDTPERRARLRAMVERSEAVFRTRTTAQWLELFVKGRIPAGPLRFPEEVFTDEQVLANGYLTALEHPAVGSYKTASPPLQMAKSQVAIQRTAPLFGQHTREVLREMGYDESHIEELVARGVVAAQP
jgi:crotonobetainyl-CoA:carnitine CoA-transferase CaiB-like acyl-CoA transferase